MTSLQIVAILCGVLGVALACALFSRYAWKGRALNLYEVLSGRQLDPNFEENFTGPAERRAVPRLVKKSPASAAPNASKDEPSNGSSGPQQKTG
jgi:hypothetical protein